MNSLLQKLMLGGSATALLATPFGAAFAQESDIEQVVVSASRISIAGYSQPTPVTVVGAAQLQRDGFADISDSIRSLPQMNTPPTTFGISQANAATAGQNMVNLRNLGVVRSLVLFDGQRAVATNLPGGVDISLLPSSLVSRIDVVTGGASAAWGSDAVSGVINFVLNKNFNGFKATIQASDTTDGLARGLSADAAWGGDVLGGRGHVEFAVKSAINPDTVVLTQEGWFKGAYWVSNPAYTPGSSLPQLIVGTNAGVANAIQGGIINSSPAGVAGPGVVASGANALRGIQFTAGGTPELVNYGNLTLGSISNGGSLTSKNSEWPFTTLANPVSNYNFFAYGRYKLTDTVQAGLQLDYAYAMSKSANIPFLQNAITIKSDNAYLPATVRSAMQNGGITSFTLGSIFANNSTGANTGQGYFQQAESNLGPGDVTSRRNYQRAVFSLDGTLGDDWSWSGYLEASGARTNYHFLGNILLSNVAAAEDAVTVTSANVAKSGLALGSIACRSTLSGTTVTASPSLAPSQSGCVPLNVLGTGVASPAAIGYATGASAGTLDYSHSSLLQIASEGEVQGTLPWTLPAGKIAVAVGGGYRQEQAMQNSQPLAYLAAYEQTNFAQFSPRSYHVFEGFAEIDAPILKNNVVNSLDFSMAGRLTDYSTSGLIETWKLGATSQVNDDIKLRTTLSVDIRAPQLNDLYALPTTTTFSQRDPKTQQSVIAITATGGNPNLVPEVARTISGGAVLTPTFLPGLSFSADWYNINITGEITTTPAATIINQCNATIPSVINLGQNGNPNDPLCSHLVFGGPLGALSQVNVTQINIQSERTSGMDLQSNYTTDFWEGTLGIAATANYVDELTINNPGAGVTDIIGSNINAGSGTSTGTGVPGPKWKGVVSATYDTGPYSFTVQGRWFGTSVQMQNGNTGNLSSAATANLYDPAHFEVPFNAYLDLRANFKWNDNISFFGAIDNALDTPPPLTPPPSSQTQETTGNYYNTNPYIYDMLGRMARIGIRLNY